MPGHGRVARDAAILSAGTVTALGINFAGTVLIARALGPEGRGIYAWLLALVFLAAQLATLAPAQAVRALAAAPGGPPPGLAWTLALLGVGGSALGLPVLLYAATEPNLGPLARPHLLAAFASVPLTAAILCLQGLLLARSRVWTAAAAQIGPRIILFGLILLLAASEHLDLGTAILLAPLVGALELGLTIWALGRTAFAEPPGRVALRAIAGRLGAGWLAALALFLMPRIGLLTLGATGDATAAGQYSVALTLQEVAGMAPAALGGVLISRAGALPGSARAGALVLGAVAGVAALGWWLAPPAIGLLFGEAFGPAAGLLRPLLASVWLFTAFQLLQPSLYAAGRLAPALPGLAGLATAGTVAFVAVPRYEAAGAVASNLAGFVALALTALLVARR